MNTEMGNTPMNTPTPTKRKATGGTVRKRAPRQNSAASSKTTKQSTAVKPSKVSPPPRRVSPSSKKASASAATPKKASASSKRKSQNKGLTDLVILLSQQARGDSAPIMTHAAIRRVFQQCFRTLVNSAPVKRMCQQAGVEMPENIVLPSNVIQMAMAHLDQAATTLMANANLMLKDSGRAVLQSSTVRAAQRGVENASSLGITTSVVGPNPPTKQRKRKKPTSTSSGPSSRAKNPRATHQSSVSFDNATSEPRPGFEEEDDDADADELEVPVDIPLHEDAVEQDDGLWISGI